MSFIDKKVLVITSCSAKKRKSSKPLKAIELYDGDFFKKVRNFIVRNSFNFMIISAKYGLISPNKKILPYDKIIKSYDDINALKEKVKPILAPIIEDYDKILLLMGEKYKKILQELSNGKFIYFFDKRGLGGYKSLMKHLLELKKRELFKLLFELKENIITIETIEKNCNNFNGFNIQNS